MFFLPGRAKKLDPRLRGDDGGFVVALVCHPAWLPTANLRVSAVADRSGDSLHIRYEIAGEIESIIFPVTPGGNRVDGLWRTTCLEAFLRDPAHSSYDEFNFAPSHDWAAYRFADYRSGMTSLDTNAPTLSSRVIPDRYALNAAIRLSPARWLLALSAVIEEIDGTKSYWGLRHPPGPPDFHHPDCFALELPALGRP